MQLSYYTTCDGALRFRRSFHRDDGVIFHDHYNPSVCYFSRKLYQGYCYLNLNEITKFK